MGTLVVPDELKKHLITAGTPVQRARGTYLFRREDAVTGIFLISRGTVRLGLDGDPAGFPSRDFGRDRSWACQLRSLIPPTV